MIYNINPNFKHNSLFPLSSPPEALSFQLLMTRPQQQQKKNPSNLAIYDIINDHKPTFNTKVTPKNPKFPPVP